MENKPEQLPFLFEHRQCLNKEDFMVTECNVDAMRMVERWPDWNYFATLIYGQEGAGKSHIANVFAQHVSQTLQIPKKIPIINADQIKQLSSEKLFEQSNVIVVEDIHPNINQEAMFHLYNKYRDEGGFILFTARNAPARMNFSLPDLQSRLNIVPTVEIKSPNQQLFNALILKLFADRQIDISPEVINYIATNAQRTFAYAKALVNEADKISLAKKRAVTINIIKDAMKVLDDNSQIDLF